MGKEKIIKEIIKISDDMIRQQKKFYSKKRLSEFSIEELEKELEMIEIINIDDIECE
jgi:hypothetical protein